MHVNSFVSNLVSDRRIPIELCPTSNHFTNGFFYQNENQYVYYRFNEAMMTMAISTDDPWISHRLTKPASDDSFSEPYPLSREFLTLPLLFSSNKDKTKRRPGRLTKSELLHLVYNGFDSAFLPARDRDALLALADLETFLVICRNDLKYTISEKNIDYLSS